GVHREDRLSHPGRTDAVNPVLVNRYQKRARAMQHADYGYSAGFSKNRSLLASCNTFLNQ
ncbi:hypothetical protein ACV1C5_22870, partial [Aeromonas caviae]